VKKQEKGKVGRETRTSSFYMDHTGDIAPTHLSPCHVVSGARVPQENKRGKTKGGEK